MEKIKIYTNANCAYCNTIKQKLKEENVEFNEFLTSEYIKAWKEVSGLTGMATVPTIEYKGEYLVPNRDYNNPDNLVRILKEMEASNETYSRRCFERIKTLNYNINIAFFRLDKTLRDIESKIK